MGGERGLSGCAPGLIGRDQDEHSGLPDRTPTPADERGFGGCVRRVSSIGRGLPPPHALQQVGCVNGQTPAGDQSLFRYEDDCINPDANGATWSLDSEAEGFTIEFGNIPSLIDYFDTERDTQQVADPYFLS